MIRLSIAILFTLSVFTVSSELLAGDQFPDWNDAQIEWHGYATGLQHACANGKPVMLFFYADWCPTCHAYKKLFRDQEITAMTQQLTMIRINIDEQPEIDASYDLNGGYVPRIFGLYADGRRMSNIYSSNEGYRYFIDADNRDGFIDLMSKIVNSQQFNQSYTNICTNLLE